VVSTSLVATKKLLGPERLDHICKTIESTLSFLKDLGNIVVTREEYSFSSKGRSVFDLGALGGCVDLTMLRLAKQGGLRMTSYHKIPSTVHKKFCILDGAAVKGTTKAEKAVYLGKIKLHTGESFDNDNIADAYMLARTLRAMKVVGSDQALFSSLCQKQVEALVASSYIKDNGLTPAKIKKMNWEEYSSAVIGGMHKSYTVFECGIGNS